MYGVVDRKSGLLTGIASRQSYQLENSLSSDVESQSSIFTSRFLKRVGATVFSQGMCLVIYVSRRSTTSPLWVGMFLYALNSSGARGGSRLFCGESYSQVRYFRPENQFACSCKSCEAVIDTTFKCCCESNHHNSISYLR